MRLRELVYRLLYCSWSGHYGLRVPLDPTLKMTTASIIRCVDCHKRLPDTHLNS